MEIVGLVQEAYSKPALRSGTLNLISSHLILSNKRRQGDKPFRHLELSAYAPCSNCTPNPWSLSYPHLQLIPIRSARWWNMANPPSKQSLIHLYSSMLRSSRAFSSYNFREYFLRRTKSDFHGIQVCISTFQHLRVSHVGIE